MPSPSSSSATSTVGQSGSLNIDALVSDTKWGGATGHGVSLTYSFPWLNGANATFSGHNGGTYTTLSEQSATYHYALNSTQQAAFRSALQSWANVANLTFSEVSDTSSSVGDIRIAWTSANKSSSTPWGWGYYPDSYYPCGGDIWISTLVSSTASGSWATGSYNFEALMHEVGHALGLKHPFDDTPVLPSSLDNRLYTIMSYTNPTNDLYPSAGYVNGVYTWITYRIYPETPMVLDIAAMQYLYGANTTYHTGNDVYTFDPATPFFKAIWDAGGTDTISVSNFSMACTIDLTPGNYSSLHYAPARNTGGVTPTYDGSNNLGIAYGCLIENATGGSGNDMLTGNSANNYLDGGAGRDTACYSGARANFTVSLAADGTHVQDKTGALGADTLANIERIQFSDLGIGFDISGNAGQVYRLYQAAFNRTPDSGGLGDWIYGMDTGMTLLQVSAGFVGSAEFKSVYGQNPTDAEVVTRFYNNVLHRAPEQAGYDYWMNQLQAGLQTRTQVLTGFSESPENQAQVIGVIQYGIEYTLHHV